MILIEPLSLGSRSVKHAEAVPAEFWYHEGLIERT
jgi:hypothetical protein